jgi:hypothetical protein
MHVGNNNTKSKTEAMFFPESLKEARNLTTSGILPPDIKLPDNQHVRFTHSFKYLGSTITTELNEDAEIKARIKKAKSLLGAARHFFNNKDVDIRTKYTIYNSFVINAALWGCKSWNLSGKNKKQLESFHHSAIRKILNIKWQQVQDERIRNKQVRFRFCNIPKIETYINRCTATYIGKIARSNEEDLPKKFLGAWMYQPRKIGGPQLSCNNNFARAISAILPDNQSGDKGLPFKEWIPIALNEPEWLNYINAYFESCKTIDEDRDDEEIKNNARENPQSRRQQHHTPANASSTSTTGPYLKTPWVYYSTPSMY